MNNSIFDTLFNKANDYCFSIDNYPYEWLVGDTYLNGIIRGDICFYIDVFRDKFLDEDNSLAFVKELLESGNLDNITIVANILIKIPLKEK